VARLPREIRDQVYGYVLQRPFDNTPWLPLHYEFFEGLPENVQPLIESAQIPNDKPSCLTLDLDATMLGEIAQAYFARTTFSLHYLESLEDFLLTSPSYNVYSADHIRRLELSVWPPYWDLDVFPRKVSQNYDAVVASQLDMLWVLHEIENKTTCIQLRVNVKAECQANFHNGNSKFNRWLEAMIPLFSGLKAAGYVLDLIQVAVIFGTRQQPRRVSDLFHHPESTWVSRIREGTIYVSSAPPSITGHLTSCRKADCHLGYQTDGLTDVDRALRI